MSMLTRIPNIRPNLLLPEMRCMPTKYIHIQQHGVYGFFPRFKQKKNSMQNTKQQINLYLNHVRQKYFFRFVLLNKW